MLREEISRLISREQSLDSFLITVTDVDLSPDLKQACVYFSSLNDKTPSSQIAEQLSRHSHQWHQLLSRRVRLKYIPRLTFASDDTLKRGDRVLDILRELDEPEARDQS
jgi:ribosome-binding factor A